MSVGTLNGGIIECSKGSSDVIDKSVETGDVSVTGEETKVFRGDSGPMSQIILK